MYARISDVCYCDEDLKGVLLIGLSDTSLYVPLDLRLSFLAVTSRSFMSDNIDS